MYKPPFHRQILPWLYVVIFLATAPVLIFYTAGYRYNPKKGAIERNGTLIVDSVPKGATIEIDGTPSGEKTPVTLQNVTPGWHSITLARDGYRSWSKTLEVRPEQVTFANNVWLWRDASATLELAAPVVGASSNPTRDRLALLLSQASSTGLVAWEPGTALGDAVALPFAPEHPPTIEWRDDGRALVLESPSGTGSLWTTMPPTTSALETLPVGEFHWLQNGLRATDNAAVTDVQPERRTLERTQLPRGTVDILGQLTLETATSSATLVLKDASLLGRVYSLPSGAWRFAGERTPYVLLRDSDRWLAVRLRGDAYAGTSYGDAPRWLEGASVPTALHVNQNEVWDWQLGEDAKLLWRQSDAVVDAVWHRSGTAVFIATRTGVFALDLDERSGRLTTSLASFDHVYGIGVIGRVLEIAADRGGQRGIWTLPVE